MEDYPIITHNQPQDVTISLQKEKPSGIRKYLDRDTIKERIAQISTPRDALLLTTLWMTGLRATEVINIRKCDLDKTTGMLRVRWQKNRRYKERLLPIHSQIAAMLDLYGASLHSTDAFFPLTRQTVTRLTHHYLGVSAHALRHSFAVNYIRQATSAASLVHLQKLLGHSHLRTTLIYLDFVPADIQKELEAIKF